MNAREAAAHIRRVGIKTLCVGSASPEEAEALWQTILAALELKAAAEASDGSTPETDILIEAVGLDPTCPNAEYFRRLERERNGLAARVVDLEPDAERYRCVRDMEHGDLEAINDASCSPEEFDAAIDAARSKP